MDCQSIQMTETNYENKYEMRKLCPSIVRICIQQRVPSIRKLYKTVCSMNSFIPKYITKDRKRIINIYMRNIMASSRGKIVQQCYNHTINVTMQRVPDPFTLQASVSELQNPRDKMRYLRIEKVLRLVISNKVSSTYTSCNLEKRSILQHR